MSEGESLDDFDHVRTLMTRSVSTACIALATLNASSVSAHDQSSPGSSPLTFKRTFRACLKQSGGGEPGDEARLKPYWV